MPQTSSRGRRHSVREGTFWYCYAICLLRYSSLTRIMTTSFYHYLALSRPFFGITPYWKKDGWLLFRSREHSSRVRNPPQGGRGRLPVDTSGSHQPVHALFPRRRWLSRISTHILQHYLYFFARSVQCLSSPLFELPGEDRSAPP